MPTTIGNQINFNSYLAGGGVATALEDNKVLTVDADLNGNLEGYLVDSEGQLISGPFIINADTESRQYYPSVTTLTDGKAVVVWQRADNALSRGYILAQFLAADGTKIGNEFQVFPELGITDQQMPKVKALKNGTFIVIWNTVSSDGYTFKAVLFDNSGTYKGNCTANCEFVPYPHQIGSGNYDVIPLNNGGFVIFWGTYTFIPEETQYQVAVWGHLYNADGLGIGSDFLIDSGFKTSGASLQPSGQVLDNGNFVVTWRGKDGARTVKVYDEACNLITDNFVIGGSDLGGASAIIPFQADRFVATLADELWPNYPPLSGRLFTDQGIAVDEPFNIDSFSKYEHGTARYPSAAKLSNGNFFITWAGPSFTYGQVFYGGDSLTATNLQQTFNYTDTTIDFDDMKVYSLSTKLTVELALPFPESGELRPTNINEFSPASASFNATTGIWRAWGYINSVNDFLASVQFFPAPGYDYQNLSISVHIEDTLHAPIIGNINILKPPASTTNSVTTAITTTSEMTSSSELTTGGSTLAPSTTTSFNPTTGVDTTTGKPTTTDSTVATSSTISTSGGSMTTNLPTTGAASTTSATTSMTTNLPTTGAASMTSATTSVISTSGGSMTTNLPTTGAASTTSATTSATTLTYLEVFGGNITDSAFTISQSYDGGSILAGETQNFNVTLSAALVLKVNSNGSMVWGRVLDDLGREQCISSYTSSDDYNYLAGFATNSGTGGWVAKLNADGDMVWAKVFAGASYISSWINAIYPSPDGGSLLAGRISRSSGYDDLLVVKLDNDGGWSWAQTLAAGVRIDEGNAITNTADGGFAIVGRTYDYGAGNSDALIVKLDASGAKQWAYALGESWNDIARAVTTTPDSGIVFAGDSYNYNTGKTDGLIAKFSLDGKLLWTRSIQDSVLPASIMSTTNGDLYLSGSGYNVFGTSWSSDASVAKLDANGNLLWVRLIGGNTGGERSVGMYFSGEGIVIGGGTTSYNPERDENIFIAKLTAEGHLLDCSAEQNPQPLVQTTRNFTLTSIPSSLVALSPTADFNLQTWTNARLGSITPQQSNICFNNGELTTSSSMSSTASSTSSTSTSNSNSGTSPSTTEETPIVSSATRPTSYVGQLFSRTAALASSLAVPLLGEATPATSNPSPAYTVALPDVASSLVLYKVLGQMGYNTIQGFKKLWHGNQTQDKVDPTALKQAEEQLICIEQHAQRYYFDDEHYTMDHFRWQIEHLRDDFNHVKTAVQLQDWLADLKDAEKVLVTQQSRSHFFKNFSATLTKLEAPEDRWMNLRSNNITLKTSAANVLDDNNVSALRMLR